MRQVIQAAAHLAPPTHEIYLYGCENLGIYI